MSLWYLCYTKVPTTEGGVVLMTACDGRVARRVVALLLRSAASFRNDHQRTCTQLNSQLSILYYVQN